MGIFDFLTADKKEEKLMQEKTSRAIAIAVSYTASAELGDDVGTSEIKNSHILNLRWICLLGRLYHIAIKKSTP